MSSVRNVFVTVISFSSSGTGYAAVSPVYVLLCPAFSSLEAAAGGDSLDWKDLSAGEIARRVRDGVKPGSIVLFHNAAKHTPEALPEVIEDLLRNGYSIVPVSELLLTGDYVMDHTGRMCRPGST